MKNKFKKGDLALCIFKNDESFVYKKIYRVKGISKQKYLKNYIIVELDSQGSLENGWTPDYFINVTNYRLAKILYETV